MSTTIPTIPSLPAGHVVTLTEMQELAYAATFLLNRPMARIRDTAGTQAITTSPVAVTYSVADFDTDGLWNSGSPDRLTVQTPGWYRVRHSTNCGNSNAHVTWVVSTTGASNPAGAGVTSSPRWSGYANSPGSGQGVRPHGCGIWPAYLYAGDYLQVQVHASATGSTLATTAPTGSTNGGSYFSLELVSI